MRNVKKFLALVLAMLMVVSAAATVSAFEDVADDHAFAAAINDLTVKEIVNGYDGETFGPDDAVTRQQMALMMARAITGNVGDDAVWAQGGLVGFEDVTEYQYAIATVVKAGIVDGFLDNTFRPEEGITFVQALKMAVCALGYDDGNLEWWNGYYNVALDLGLTENLNYITDADKALNRGEVAQLIYNMLYVELADGSDCFASQNFGLATAENVTTFVITATDEQTAAEGMDVTEGGYVGLQALVNGVPEGDVCYVPVEMLGFEEDEDEEYFLHAFNVVNWNAETATFDQIIPTGDSWKIYNAEISAIKNNKFTYESKNYYPVEELTGTAIKNEVVLFSAVDFGYTTDNKQLFLNKNGEVMHPSGEYAILEAVYSVNGDVVSYRVLRDDVDTNVTKGSYLSVAKATALFGAEVGSITVPYTTMDETELTGAYELTAFDDDLDGKMDRAYWTPVYVSVYEGYDSDNVHDTDGPFKGDDEDTVGKITGLDDLAEGDVFVYTYNEQLLDVTVLEVLEVEQGTVKKINTTKKSTSDGYSTITLTDGTALTLYNASTKLATAEEKLGATIKVSGAIDYTDEKGWMYQISDGLELELVNDTELLENLKAGSLIRYYARNGVVLFAETYDIDDVYERVVLKDVLDADLEAVYLDVYKDGEVEEIAVTVLKDVNGKVVDLADVSWLKVSAILSDLVKADNEGKVYRISELENGYQLSEALKLDGSNADDFKLVKITVAGSTGLIDREITEDIQIEDNIAVLVPGSNDYNKYNRLRTNEDTIWYFIDADGDVTVFSGELENARIDVTTNTDIFVDKLGYSGDNKGTASVVYVYNAGVDTVGFGWGDGDKSIVYVSGAIDYAHTWDYYEQGNAEEVGLDEDEYTETSYYKYSSSYVMDMYTGKPVTIYSVDALEAATFYFVNEDGVVYENLTVTVGEDNEDILKTELYFEDIDFEDRDIGINGLLHKDFAVDYVYALGATAKTDAIKKTESKLKELIPEDLDEAKIVYVVNEYASFGANDEEDEDGVFAMIVGEIETPDVELGENEVSITYNAVVEWSNVAHAAQFVGKAGKQIDGVVTSTDVATGDYEWNDTVVGNHDKFVESTWTLTSVKEGTTAASDLTVYEFTAEANKDGNLAITLNKKQTTPNGTKDLTADKEYTVVLTNANGTVVTIYFKTAK